MRCSPNIIINRQSFFFPLSLGRALKFSSRIVSESTGCSTLEPDVNEKNLNKIKIIHLNVLSQNVSCQTFNLEL